MKLISINALKEGEKLYSNITNCKGVIMLKNGTSLTNNYIDKLKNAGIFTVYVDDDFSDDMEIRPAISEETKLVLLEHISTFQKSILKGKKVDFNVSKKMSRSVFEEVRGSAMKPINLVNTYAIDYPVLLHSMNVAVIVAALTAKAGIRQELAESYIVAAMFHDIALASMDEDNDPEHAVKAYETLKNSAVISPNTYVPVLLHHEHYDGTGKPKAMKGSAISEGARIIAVADMYDNLLFGHSGYKRMSPYKAVEYMSAESGKALDPAIVDLFAQCIAVYPTGATVLLNNGYEAIVISQNEGMPTRPIVRVIKTIGDEYEVLNLMWEHTLFIDELYL